jgi:hypothetical protein
MKNSTLSNLHLDDLALDRLRAGLLDDRAAHAHIENCAVCRQRLSVWDRLAKHLHSDVSPDDTLDRQLRDRRRTALAGRATGRMPAMRRWTPQYLAMAATVAALAIGLSVFFTLDLLAPDTTGAQTEGMPDIYADIDFYLWLTTEGLGESAGSNAS